jgi:hypothetical protein
MHVLGTQLLKGFNTTSNKSRSPCRRICVGCLIDATQRRFLTHWLGPQDSAAIVYVRSRSLEELEVMLQVGGGSKIWGVSGK